MRSEGLLFQVVEGLLKQSWLVGFMPSSLLLKLLLALSQTLTLPALMSKNLKTPTFFLSSSSPLQDLMSCLCRWEDELAEKVEYNADNTVKTEIVKSPFIQVYLVFMSHSLHLFRNSFLFFT